MIAILGAGSLGRLWAASLPPGRAAFVPRPGASSDSIPYQFHPVSGEAFSVDIPQLGSDETPELLLVTTKAGDTLDALHSALPNIPANTPVVLFQNGLGSQQQVADTWPGRPILAASTTEGANRPAPDVAVHAGKGATWVGALTRTAESRLPSVVDQLSESGLTVHAETDILPRLWQKLVINAGINPFTALLDCPNGEILEAPLFRQWITPLCEEIASLMAGAGQDRIPPDELRGNIETVARSTATNTSSMRADILAGRRTEIEYINGYLVRLGDTLDIATPVNRMLTERVQLLNH
ncbi:ketopantoate reductase [Marinobacter persicus]|uniref:2-dehydropantoate 2-reductase n=1 Tax=Marinobacter persicus TaxID=930118 RepID=A0A1I3Y6H4_9GAMM|nr:2-dehydropantoate 2-reductase [Marinobacter persicus]GHD53064.1 putative 2-dehydropantoate 2-reductase [Marinobacter persicus]SFK27474.1 ketopantoate reductase [Marinobacter persicus]